MKEPYVKIDGEFTDISSELYRKYEFPTGQVVKIDFPLWLHVASSGSHRIIDAQGFSHYIPWGWGHVLWKVKDGSPFFVK